MDKRTSKPISLGDSLRSYLGKLDRGGKLAEARVKDVWEEIVGPGIGDHAAIKGLNGRELIVFVDSPSWATELSYMAEDLRNRINAQMGQPLVGSVRFTVSSAIEKQTRERDAEAQAARRYGGERVAPVALSESEMGAVERSLAAIKDPDLKEAALRATVRDLEWKKGLEASKRP